MSIPQIEFSQQKKPRSQLLNLTKVFRLLQGHEESRRGCRHLSLLGHKLCNKGWCKLMGIGKQRFANLMSAVNNGKDFAPLDGRFMPKAEGCKQSPKREAVYDFLFQLWQEAGETLPDEGHSSSNKRPRQAGFKFDDSTDRSQIRHIPPGKFVEYLRLCRLQHPDLTISYKLFSSVGASMSAYASMF